MRRDGIPHRRSSGSRGSSWTPAVLPGLGLWFRSDLGIMLTDGLVSAWADQGPSANHATQGDPSLQFAYVESDPRVKGRPSLTGADGKLMQLTNAATVSWLAIVAVHPLAVFSDFDVLMARATGASGATFLVGNSGTSDWATAGSAIAGTRSRNRVVTNVALGGANQPFLYEFVPNTPGPGTAAIGNAGDVGGNYVFGWKGSFIEIITRSSGQPSAADRIQLAEYCTARYGFAA